MDEKLVTT